MFQSERLVSIPLNVLLNVLPRDGNGGAGGNSGRATGGNGVSGGNSNPGLTTACGNAGPAAHNPHC